MSRRARLPPLIEAIEASLERLDLSRSAGLLAVSGGADSMALLCATHELAPRWGLRLEICTVDHGLRPLASAEAAQVEAEAAVRGLVCHVRRLEVGHQPGLEARARVLREAQLEAVRVERGLDWIATAHTANDQAETLLMRLGRGAGLRGAASILERKGPFVRPMLEVTRAQVEAYLAQQGVGFASDPMNTDPTFLRVRVRRGVLPALTDALGVDAVLHLARFARLAATDERTLRSQAEDALTRLRLADGSLDTVGLRALLPAIRSRLWVWLLERQGVTVSSPRLDQLEDCLWKGGHVALDRQTQVRMEGGRLRVLAALPGTTGPDAYPLVPGQPVQDASSGLTLSLLEQAPGGVWALPLAASALPLTIRRRQPGDRVRLSTGQTSKLQDLLVNAKVPRERRDRLPVIVSAGGEILGVAGVWPKAPVGSGRWHLIAS